MILNKLRKSYRFKLFLFYLFRIIPLKKQIVFCNFSGKRCADSPLVISNKLKEQYPKYKQIWLVHPKYNVTIPKGVKVVSFGMNSLKMIYALATSKIWVDSHTKFSFVRKRNGQYYLNTWHGGLGLKKIEFDAKESFDDEYLARVSQNSFMVDLFISNSLFFEKILKSAFHYSGDILRSGIPRNDCLVNDDRVRKTKVHQYYGISPKRRIILYAPTFRVDLNVECYRFDTAKVIKSIEKKFGNDFVMLVRLHPLLLNAKSPFIYNENVIDGTSYPDMQELLLETDILISDYSSTMFDYMLLNRPIFLYATDLEQYKQDRNLYFDYFKLPFMVSENENDLRKNIELFDEKKYKEKMENFKNENLIYETGHATDDAVNWIVKKMEK